MKLIKSPVLLSQVSANYVPIAGNQDRWITGLTSDSREVKPGNLFLGLPGNQDDGRHYVSAAIVAGAAAVFIQGEKINFQETQKVPIWTLPKLSEQIGLLAANFYHHPTRHLQMIGITGTSGKTSCSQLIARALNRWTYPCGVIGTLGVGFPDNLISNSYTTPDAISLQRYLAELLAQGAKAVVMEVSSHALALQRTVGIDFHSGIFTNLSRDHLDFHSNMENYAAAKWRLFSQGLLKQAILNIDDFYGSQWYADLSTHMLTYGYSVKENASSGSITAQLLVSGLQGMEAKVLTPWGEGWLKTKLLGSFNLSNLLAVLTQLCSMDYPLTEVLATLAELPGIPGRMEYLGGGSKPLIVIDYAHKPDALAKALGVLREQCQGQLYCVIGCGGNRDLGKRPVMGEIADQYADKIVLTSDNPRDEDPQSIIQQIFVGIRNPAKVMVENDRGLAINYAIQNAEAKDIVLIAGKGHETYQIIKGNRLAFSDKEQAERALNER